MTRRPRSRDLLSAVVAAVAATLLLSMAQPPATASSARHRSCVNAASFVDGSARVDNLRLERIGSGPLAGRIVVAGRVDLAHAERAQQVRLRMTVREPNDVIARRVWDYALPPGVAPQDLTLRLLLSRSASRAVDAAGRQAGVVVDVWQHDDVNANVTKGHRHSVVTRNLCERPMPTLTRAGTLARADAVFIPAGYYASAPDSAYYLWTAEDTNGAPYVGGLGFIGTAANEHEDYWVLSPAWMYAGLSADYAVDGRGYVRGSLPTSWTMTTTLLVDCPDQVTASGTFPTSTTATAKWSTLTCAKDVLLVVGGGSVKMTAQG